MTASLAAGQDSRDLAQQLLDDMFASLHASAPWEVEVMYAKADVGPGHGRRDSVSAGCSVPHLGRRRALQTGAPVITVDLGRYAGTGADAIAL